MIRAASTGRLAPVNVAYRIVRLVARTACGIAPALARPDDAFAEAHLAGGELAAYRAMDPRDRDHACRVARRLLDDAPDADPVWVRAALLHDVGKAGGRYRLWERVLVHVWTPDVATADRFPPAWADAWRRHRDHAVRGAGDLRAAGADARVVDLVARHHDAPCADEALRRLARADEGA